MMLHAKYERSRPYGLGQEDFLKFFPSVAMQPEYFTEFNSLKYFERAWPKDHFCEVWLKSDS